MPSINLKRLSIGILCLGALTSCVGFQGQLVVNEQFKVKEKKKTVVVPVGVYSARIAVKSKRKLKLIIENSTMKKTAVIKLKKGYKLPAYDGDFQIPASAFNQSFKIQGHKQTTVSRTESRTEDQNCTVQRVRTKCEKVCTTEVIKLPNGETRRKRTCKRVCRDIVRHIPGLKQVSYHYKTVKQDLEMTLVDKASLAPVADYSGGNSATSTVYDFVGACRIRVRRF